MALTEFNCVAYGKWILVGEHSVIRGFPALVFPIPSRNLHLHYTKNDQPLTLVLQGDHGAELQMLVWGVLDKAFQKNSASRTDFTGVLTIESSLPVGAGMGASAALCVALTRWLGFLGFVAESEYYDFARNLEDLFHGESSGVDIAVALSGQGLHFIRNVSRTPMVPVWKPKWYISYSGQRGVTVDAVNKVKNILSVNPELGKSLDLKMADAVSKCHQALLKPQNEGFPELALAIEQAGQCFEAWGLNEGVPAAHIQYLRTLGAAAVKPTGSGGGGYVLSLWKDTPPPEALKFLIPCS